MRKALVINPHGISDMGDLLAVARAEGKRAFRTKEHIRVLPAVFRDGEGNLVVEVELHSPPGAGELEEK